MGKRPTKADARPKEAVMHIEEPSAAETFLAAVASRIRERRESLGLSQEGVAKRSGLSLRLIRHIESGRADFNVVTLQAVAKGLGVEPHELANVYE